MRNNQDKYGSVQDIYSWSGRKTKTFSKNVCPIVRSSVRKTSVTKTSELIMRVFLIESCILGIKIHKISTRSQVDLRRLSRMKFLKILLYLGNRLMISILMLFVFYKYGLENNARYDWTQSYDVCRSWSRMKVVFAISCYPYKIKN